MVGPLVSLFSCSDRWIPLVWKVVLVALSALGFFLPTFNFTFWKSSCLFFFDFISTVCAATCLTYKNRAKVKGMSALTPINYI